jgi:pimeloyl-ACP methyl ester carboxylesterase
VSPETGRTTTRGRRSRWGKTWRLAVAAAIGLLLGLGIVSLLLSSRYVAALTGYACSPTGLGLDDLGLTVRPVTFGTSDGLMLSGSYVRGGNGAVVILLEGMGARGGLWAEAQMLARNGYGLLAFDWRGCGASDSAQHTLGFRETHDLLAAVEYLSREPGVDAIGALGFSMGGAVAIQGAAVEPRILAVVAMGSYHDLEDEIYGAGDAHPLLSLVIESEVAWLFQRRTGIDFDQAVQPVDVVGKLCPRPLLLIYGEREEAIPPASGQLLFQAADEPKELWILPGVGHGGYLQAQRAEFERRVIGFFTCALLR